MEKYIKIRNMISSTISRIDAAMISNYRDDQDVKYFGFSSIKDAPDVLPWVEQIWENQRARLFMIGSTTEDCDSGSQKTNLHFLKAAEVAVACGARVILFAASTKRLKIIDVLRVKYPHVIFTLGDNLTSLFLKKGVQFVIDLIGTVSRILVVAPHGILGGEVADYLLNKKYEVVGLIKIARIESFRKRTQMNMDLFNSFERVGKVDMVITCGNKPNDVLTPERIEMIRRPGRKLLVIDPCQPPNMEFTSDKVIRVDAGNGYSADLKYVFEPISYEILRLAKGVAWGCFCETLIISRHLEEFKDIDWFKINDSNQSILEKAGGFSLPNPTCFNKEITDWNMSVNL